MNEQIPLCCRTPGEWIRISCASGVDPREVVLCDSRAVSANWLPQGTALVMSSDAIDVANWYGYGLRSIDMWPTAGAADWPSPMIVTPSEG